MPEPLYDVLLACHVAAAVLGFGSVAVGGLAASSGRRSRDPVEDERLARFFSPGPDWPSRLVYLVPVIGVVLLFGGDRSAVTHPWPWAGLALWVAAAGVLTARGWPAERRAQRELALARGGDRAGLDGFRHACSEMERAAAITSVIFFAAVAVMVLQP